MGPHEYPWASSTSSANMTSGVLLVFVMQHAAARSACTLGAYHAKGRGPGRRAAASASGASASGERGSGTAEGGASCVAFVQYRA